MGEFVLLVALAIALLIILPWVQKQTCISHKENILAGGFSKPLPECGEEKDLAEFYNDSNTKDGKTYRCRTK